MTDEQLTELFAEGTALERDAVFTYRVEAEIERARRSQRLFALAIRGLIGLTLAAAVFATIRMLEPMLGQIAESLPHFMGVPLPLVLGALAVGMAVRARRFILLRLV